MRGRGDALVVTDGFSCKTQLEQGVGAHSLHLAEVIRLASGRGESVRPQPSRRRTVARAGALVSGALALAGAVAALRPR